MCYSGNCRLPQAGQFELLANFVNVNNQQRLQIVEAVHCEKQQPASMHTCWTILILFIHMLWTCDGLPGEPFFPSWFSSCTCCGPAVVYQVKLGCHLDSLPACVVDLWWFTRWTLVAALILFLHVLWTCGGLPGEPRLPCWFSSCTCCGPVMVYQVNLGCGVDSLPAHVVDLCIIIAQSKTGHIVFDTITACITPSHWVYSAHTSLSLEEKCVMALMLK